jgi:uncharacterized membrane protein (UPF0127 family)
MRLVGEGGRVVCERCVLADNAWTRMRGLLGRKALDDGEGLLIRPSGSIHMFFMRFPIDVVFLSRDGEVLKVARALPAWRTAAARRAKAVLELTADEADLLEADAFLGEDRGRRRQRA